MADAALAEERASRARQQDGELLREIGLRRQMIKAVLERGLVWS